MPPKRFAAICWSVRFVSGATETENVTFVPARFALVIRRFVISTTTSSQRRSQLDIEGSAIGACVQIEGYDLARIVGTARFVDNERDVETASVSVPARGPSF
ncbi:MAG: hypothetical protein U0353_08405 [Sandaracinus sp.]